MKLTLYLISRVFIWLFGILPFPLLYFISGSFYCLAYYVIKYRKAVVVSNLKMAFPEKPDHEITLMTKEFYKHLAGILVESFKGLSMSKKSIVKRHKILNPEILDKYFERNISIIGVSGHYGNWEWGTASGGLQIKHKTIGFYQPLTNPYFEQYIRKNREKFSTQMVSVKNTFETFKANEGKACAYLMIADQCPSHLERSFWVNFMGIETPFLHGPEKYAKMYNLPVIYIDIKPVKKGFYELELIPVTENPLELREGELTGKFARLLEERIVKNPRYWLWSHRRWKNAKLKVETLAPGFKMQEEKCQSISNV